jgi:hypothetical protein
MDKKDIYEHLAKIYLDASFKTKKKKKPKFHPQLFRNLFLLSIVLVVGLSFALFFDFGENKPLNSEIALVLLPDAAKINFNFNPAKKEIYSLDLNNLNLNKFKFLNFSVKNSAYQNPIALRVEFTNIYKEKSWIYLKDISHKWRDYSLKLLEFKNISDWSEMSNLSFIVEEWNTKEKKGVVYIDNVRLLK